MSIKADDKKFLEICAARTKSWRPLMTPLEMHRLMTLAGYLEASMAWWYAGQQQNSKMVVRCYALAGLVAEANRRLRAEQSRPSRWACRELVIGHAGLWEKGAEQMGYRPASERWEKSHA